MCRHIINAQVFIQSFCCGKWYECSECHDEVETDHQFTIDRVLRLMCKPCRRVFERDLTSMMESDKFCEQCKNMWCPAGNACGLFLFNVWYCNLLPAWMFSGVTPESLIYTKSKAIMQSMYCTLLDNAGLPPKLMPSPVNYAMTKSKALSQK
jgi:uncharacterized CHY-type Zn-finger protein